MLMLIVQSGALTWLTKRLAAVGRMALSNYLTHSIVCTTLFYGYGFGLFGNDQPHGARRDRAGHLGFSASDQPDLAAGISASARPSGSGARLRTGSCSRCGCESQIRVAGNEWSGDEFLLQWRRFDRLSGDP